MGYDFTRGRISHFPIDFCMGLTTVQRKGAACDKLTLCENVLKVGVIKLAITTCVITQCGGEILAKQIER